MSKIDISKDSAVKISSHIKNKEVSVREVLESFVKNYEANNPDINAILSFNADTNYK